MSKNTLPGNDKLHDNDEYLRQQANFEHENELDGIEREQEMLADDARMIPAREMWDSNRTAYHDRLNKIINTKKDEILKYALNHPDGPASMIAERTPFDNKRIQSLTKRRGGKSRVFRKKSNKTKTKKVSRRNRHSRNIRRSRNSRAHKRK